MLPIQPKYNSVTPMMVFTGQSHQAALLSHNLSAGPTQYDSLLMVSRIGVEESCLIVTLETEAAGQPLSLTLYTEKGRQVLPMNKAAPITRQTFLAAAFVIVESLLHDRLQLPVMPQGKPVALEKPLHEFYPDAGQRLKMHYFSRIAGCRRMRSPIRSASSDILDAANRSRRSSSRPGGR
jgi:hypothetical protein